LPQERDYDVIIVGSGIAGHCAALEAVEAGARVLMIDAEPRIGGSSRLSTGIIMGAGTRFQHERGIDDSPQRLYRHYVTANHWLIQPSVAHRLCFEAGPTIEWLNDRGVAILDIIASGEEDRPRGHVTGGGHAIIDTLAGHLANHDGVDTALKTRVDRLLQEEGKVVGVGVGADRVTARAVVIATGGMAANQELLQRYHPEAIAQANGPLHHQGTPWAQGDAIALAYQVKAQILYGRGSRAPDWKFGGGYLPSYVVVVNQLGRRFYTETSSYSASEIALGAQPNAIGYILFDEATKQAMQRPSDVERHMKVILPETGFLQEGWTSKAVDGHVDRGHMVRSETLELLAERLGIPEDNLRGTLERYNAHVAGGEDADYFKPRDGLRPVATPPFYAATMTLSLLALSAAGMRIDHDACVMHETNRAIPGLYAAGECVGGVLGTVYVGSGNSVANCLVFGRVAGRNAAAYALASV